MSAFQALANSSSCNLDNSATSLGCLRQRASGRRRNAPKPVQDFLVPAIQQYYEGHPQAQRDETMRSCGMAAMTLMLAAKEMGYDTCPMDGFDFDQVAKLLNLPRDHTPTMFVCVGKGIKEAMPRGGQLPLDQVVIHNQFK